MQFPDNVITEVTAPNNVPFAPGNDVIGLGTVLPAELQATNITSAEVFYSSGYSATATTPKVKYFYIAVAHSGVIPNENFGISIGYCIVTNPSVSQTGTLITLVSMGCIIQGASPSIQNYLSMSNIGNHVVVEFLESIADHSGSVQTFNNAGTNTGHLP